MDALSQKFTMPGMTARKTIKDWADRNNADEVIVLLSSFDVDSSGGDGSLNPNSTYSDWKWILVRTDGGQVAAC